MRGGKKKIKKHWGGLSVGLLAVPFQYGLYVFGHLSKWFVFVLMFKFWSVYRLWNGRPTIGYNSVICAMGGDFTTELSYEAHTSNLRKTVIRSTEPPLLPNRCYQLPFCPSEELLCQVCTELSHCYRAVVCTLFCFCSVGLCGVAKANVSANVWALYALSLRLQAS